MKYYAMDSDGYLWKLGDHGDFDAAEDTAIDLLHPAEPLWIADETRAIQWRETLTSAEY